MKRNRYHLPILTVLLISMGIGFTIYQRYYLGIPFNPNEHNRVWTIEAVMEFTANSRHPVKAEMFIPKITNQPFIELNESFISRNYGISVHSEKYTRRAVWSVRKTHGKQYLYYRLTLMQPTTNEQTPHVLPPDSLNSHEYTGAKKIAADAIITEVREKSADTSTFTSETIKYLNSNDNNVKILLKDRHTLSEVASETTHLLSNAKIPAQVVHGVFLEPTIRAKTQTWLRSFDGKEWHYYNLKTAEQGLPSDVLIWWVGNEPLYSTEGARNAEVEFSIKAEDLNALSLIQQSVNSHKSAALDFSLLSLPIQSQHVYKILIMVPVGVLVILLLRCFIGIATLGTFMPVLIALAFRETQLFGGIALFSLVVALGLLIRAYIEQLKLLLVARLSIILCSVILLMCFISIITYKLGIEHGLSVALFPMVILTMTIERMSIIWDERGGFEALTTGCGSLFAASLAYLSMSSEWLAHTFFVFPGCILIIMAIMLLLGRYRGYRLSELFRFHEFQNKGTRT